MDEPRGLRVRKLAKTDGEVRIRSFDPTTGQKALYNPATERHEPWPLLGLTMEGEAPPLAVIPTSFVAKGLEEGWLQLEGIKVVHRSAGNLALPWESEDPHEFIHADAIVLDFVEQTYRYRVTQQPDKWPEEKDGPAGFGGEVCHFYLAELEVADG